MELIKLGLIILIASLTSCKELKYPANEIQKTKRLELKIFNSCWYTSTQKFAHAMVGNVNLTIKGKTNAERLTIRTYGDGLISDRDLKLDTNGSFNDTIEICFTYFSSIPNLPIVRESKTNLKAYLGSEMIDTTFSSGQLQYNK